jgi:ATP-dependent protease ClpP protease subunit
MSSGTDGDAPGRRPADPTQDTTYSSILQEHDVARSQRETRKSLLKELTAKEFNDGGSPNGVIAQVSRAPLAGSDIPVFGNVLRGIGDVETLSLILHSSGGDGTIVEKIISLCRTQCKRFRVIIPNEAKSAATLIALGADEIVMGPPSELGPIDAQVPVVANGVPQYLSAQSFIDARDELKREYQELTKKGEDAATVLQMIASLDMPFIKECERMMDFGRDVARKLLSEFMFRRARNKTDKIHKVVDTLSSVKRFKVHGRYIDGNTARRELELKIHLLGKDEPLWAKIWEYYTRAEIAIAGSRAIKLLESEHELLVATVQSENR